MAYSQFEHLSDVTDKFGLAREHETNLFPHPRPVEPSALLTAILEDYRPLALDVGTEKARSEFLISPILAEVRRQTERQTGIFSGVDFNVDPKQGLNGFCDYIIARSPDLFELKAPVLAIVEAKKEDITAGLGQCAAAMVAARLFNRVEGNRSEAIFGAVTSGSTWRFLKLDESTIFVDSEERYLNPIPDLLGILLEIVRPLPNGAAGAV